jgi:hypothetical protein
MCVGNIALVIRVITCRKPKISGACHLINLSSLGAQSFVGNRKIESWRNV